jgi:TRAP-type C4-dicarboxylate transport system permease small subunit
MLYAMWLFFAGSWTQTKIGMTTFSTVLHYPNALMAASGLVCSASMLVIVGLNLVRILIDHPAAQIAGEPSAADAVPHAPHASAALAPEAAR